MTVRATTLVNRIEKAFPNISGVNVRRKDEVFLGDVAEGGEIDGLPACNYYGFDEDPTEKIWVMGVHKKLADLIEKSGWFVECGDPGTYFAYPA